MTAGRAAMAKKNKKKQKAKTAQGNNYSNNNHNDRREDEEEEDEVQISSNGPNSVYVNTGLAPELESVHISTTASLNPKNPNNNIKPDLHQLMATAHHLYQQSSLGHFRETDMEAFTSAEEYWASLPEKFQSMIRQASHNLSGSPAERQKTLMNIVNGMAKGERIPGDFPLPDPQTLLGLDLSQSQAELAKLGVPNAMYGRDGEYDHDYVNGGDDDDYGTEDDDDYPEEHDHSQHPGIGGGKKKNKKKKKKSLGSTQVDLPVSSLVR